MPSMCLHSIVLCIERYLKLLSPFSSYYILHFDLFFTSLSPLRCIYTCTHNRYLRTFLALSFPLLLDTRLLPNMSFSLSSIVTLVSPGLEEMEGRGNK